MKKLLICSVFALAACVATTNTGLTRLETEPKDCEFLYTIDTSFADYNMNKAYEFLEQKILENLDAIFGPKSTYKFKTKVYNCKK